MVCFVTWNNQIFLGYKVHSQICLNSVTWFSHYYHRYKMRRGFELVSCWHCISCIYYITSFTRCSYVFPEVYFEPLSCEQMYTVQTLDLHAYMRVQCLIFVHLENIYIPVYIFSERMGGICICRTNSAWKVLWNFYAKLFHLLLKKSTPWSYNPHCK